MNPIHSGIIANQKISYTKEDRISILALSIHFNTASCQRYVYIYIHVVHISGGIPLKSR